jgi:serine/threonine-protein kinase
LFLTQREDGTALIKILDFGIAKISAESTGTTQSGQILGTPLYMSPEQARGDPALIGPSSDLYALGLIAYKLLTGYPYWNATSVAGIIGQVLYEPMTPPSTRGTSLGPEFDRWFLRACHREPSQRFTSAAQQIEALASSLGLPTDARSDLLRSNPGDSGSGLLERSGAGLSTTGRRQQEAASANKPEAATIAQSGTLVSSSKEMPDVRVVTISRRRRGYLYGVMSAAVLLSIGVVLFYRNEPVSSPLVLAKPAAAPLEAKAVPILPDPPAAVAEPTPPAEAPAAAPSAMNVAAAPASVAKPKAPIRPPASKPPAAAAPARGEKTIVNDPLGDQK